ncbi:MAG: hypothetical protein K2K26_06300 [Muribaculaceae bacterium]|nr:hypothetical protein [Muribaculaceae bacterium]
MVNDKNNLRYLLQEIDRYFDCLLTDEEENELRKKLATTKLTHRAIDEAKALMGFRLPEKIRKRKADSLGKKFSYKRVRYAAVIAAVAALISLTVCVFQLNSSFVAGNCLAFVNGKCIRDEDAVMEIIFQNISELEQATDEMRVDFLDELDDLASATEYYDSELNLSDI